MKPIKMPDNWHNQFVGIRIRTGHQFRVSKRGLTDAIVQVANYIIDMNSGTVLKNRYGITSVVDDVVRCAAKEWPIVHDQEFGNSILRSLSVLMAVGVTHHNNTRSNSLWASMHGVPADRQVVNVVSGTLRGRDTYGMDTSPSDRTATVLSQADGIS